MEQKPKITSKDKPRTGIHNHWIIRIMVSAETPVTEFITIFFLPFSVLQSLMMFFFSVPVLSLPLPIP